MSATYTPAQQKAIEYLKQYITQNALSEGDILAPVKALAKDAKVSVVTMWRAIGVLRDEGAIIKRSDRRLAVAAKIALAAGDKHQPAAAQVSLQSETRQLWERCRQRIEQDIFSARFESSELLPSHKQLMALYDVSYPTLRKALSILEQEGTIVAKNRGFAIRSNRAARASSRIVLLGHADRAGRVNIQDLDMRALEAECSRNSVRLDSFSFVDYDDRGMVYKDSHGEIVDRQFDDDSTLGFIYLNTMEHSFSEELLSVIAQTKKPVAIQDDIGNWRGSRTMRQRQNIKVFTAKTSLTPARDIARYCIDHGHRHAAFLSPYHETAWSEFRYEGIRSVFEKAGPGFELLPFAAKSASYGQKLPSDSQLKPLLAKYNALFAKDSTMFDIEYQKMMYRMQYRESIRSHFNQFLKKALSKSAITLWIAVNDETAMIALKFLQERKMAIPHSMSLISFDDSPNALYHRITSYNFNMPGLARAMVSYVLHPRAHSSFYRRKKITIDGMIVERQSVASV